jgi:hypothetical protein
MSAKIKITHHTNLGAVAGLQVTGHKNIRYFSISVDWGHGDPAWPIKQTLPDVTFSLNPSTVSGVTASGLYSLLKANRVKAIKYNNRFFVGVYSYALITRKSAGLMMRKLSVTESL